MKAKINGIEIEGDVAEIAAMLDHMANVSKPKEKTSVTTFDIPSSIVYSQPKSTIISNKDAQDSSEYSKEINDFVNALYRYRPDRNTPHGRSGYAVRLLATGKEYTIKSLMKLSNITDQSIIASAVRRAAAAGCIIEITGNSNKLMRNNKIRMISMGTVEQATATRLSLAPSTKAQKIDNPQQIVTFE